MIDILENKQYITDINSKWTFFKFPNGKEDRVATNIKLTDDLLDYFRNEYRFYKRMYEELKDISDKKRKEVDKLPRHTEEEIIHYLTGNLCRCTGYMGQLRAIKTYMGVK